jgi:hypothetical protein
MSTSIANTSGTAMSHQAIAIEHLPGARRTARAPDRRLTRIAEYQARTARVDDVLMAVLVIAVISWSDVLVAALITGML